MPCLLRDPQAAWVQPAITTHGYKNHAVRTEEWRYIRYADGSEELYDHEHDPYEWTNLAGDSGFAEVKSSLQQSLPEHNAQPKGRADAAPQPSAQRRPKREVAP